MIYSSNKNCKKNIEDNLVLCTICTNKKKKNNIMTCSYCKFKWCIECLRISDNIFNEYQIIRKNKFLDLNDLKKLISLQSCPICRKFRKFEEFKMNDKYLNFKYEFINLVKFYSKDLYQSDEKKYKCLNCNINQKSNKIIPQCNKCNLFNMMKIP